jgi:hypothetical protein
MGMMQDLVKKAMPVQNTTIGTARALLYNCKQQADNSLWYTSKFAFGLHPIKLKKC